MNPEIPNPEKNQITREQLVEHLKKMVDTPKNLQWDVETKRMIHEWKISRLQSVSEDQESKVRLEIALELAAICREVGLKEEELEQYKNFFDNINAQRKIDERELKKMLYD